MKTVLFVLGGGIGNIVQATPAIKAIAASGFVVDLKLHCNSTKNVESIFSIPAVRKVFVKTDPIDVYNYQLNGPFTSKFKHKAKKFLKTRIYYAQNAPEFNVYFDLARQLGVSGIIPEIEINLPQKGFKPEHQDTVAIYPGSKPNWAMKRWNKYDHLAAQFKHVMVVGTHNDIHSHGNPTWITKPWKWPKNATFFQGGLQEVAYAISKCKMFIGNDGGLAHIAAATKIPTFVLFGPSSQIKNRPYAKKAHVIALCLKCQPCQFKTANGQQIFNANHSNCMHDMKCMRKMSVQYVMSKINALL